MTVAELQKIRIVHTEEDDFPTLKSLGEMTPEEHEKLCHRAMKDNSQGKGLPFEDAYRLLMGKEFVGV